jgi:tRNA-2-methylthio-N6-dimethylallyladenosine synthase
VLKAMRRTYSRERFAALAHRLRDEVPGLALTTDVIVGFPGESEDDFAETLAVCEEVSFDHAFTFIYSPRRGTDAARMQAQVGEDVKRDRLERLVEVVQRHAHARNQQLVGTRQEVLVEGPSRTDPDVLRGRTRTNKTVLLADAEPGELVPVRIEAATSQTLRGARERLAAAV